MNARILIDPGHGGRDPGAIGHLAGDGISYREADLAYDYARTLRLYARMAGHDADYTRTQAEGKPIMLRVAQSHLKRYDACVSLHLNAGGGTGWEIWYRDDTDAQLARAIANAIRAEPALQNLPERGIKHESIWRRGKRIGVLSMRSPVVLIELGFIDNPNDLAQLIQREVRIAYAKAILQGIERAVNRTV